MMSIWELRQAIEQTIPWWAPLVIIGTIIIIFWATVLIERRRKK